MACGTPVVSTRCGGPEEYLTDHEAGRLVPKNDPDAMASALMELLTTPDRQKLEAKARTTIEQRYARSTISERFEATLESLRPDQ